MTLTEQGYKPRLIDSKIVRYLKLFGALSIEGPKWCGKTWTALNQANSVVYILDPEDEYANREAARLNPASILGGETPLLIDEWQEVPGIWDAVRFAADSTRKKGLYLLTGSVTPSPEQYISALAETDISDADNKKRNPDLAKHLLAALARTNVTSATVTTLSADIQARYSDVSRQTVSDYLSVLKRLFVIEEIPQWFPELRDKLRLRKMPKRMLTDPSLAVSALKARPQDLARDPRTLGMLFENLCLRDLLIYAEAEGAKLSHYHDTNDLEVDAIIELGMKWAAFEIKLGAHRVDEGAATLKRLRSKLVAKGANEPAFCAVITGGGPRYTRDDGILVIPIDCLRP